MLKGKYRKTAYVSNKSTFVFKCYYLLVEIRPCPYGVKCRT